MAEIEQLVSTLKRQLRQQGKTYKDVAAELGLSEPSVKRLFASGKFELGRLVQIANLLGFTLAELTQEAAAGTQRLHHLTLVQERSWSPIRGCCWWPFARSITGPSTTSSAPIASRR